MSANTLNEPHSGDAGSDKLVFDGTGGSLFVIYLVNILLTILTLGIYQFWAKTRIRRFVWAHTRYQGDAFEYTGTGMELFIGFVIVFFAFLVPVYAVSFFAQMAMVEGNFVLAGLLYAGLVLTIFFLFGFAVYRAYRYRLTRTLWRGIRGALAGSPMTYTIRYFGYTLLQLVTLWLATPMATIRLYDYMLNNVYLGSGRFSFKADWMQLMPSFLAAWPFFAIGTIMIVGAYIPLTELQMELQTAQEVNDGQFDALRRYLAVMFGGFGVLLLGAIASQWYIAKLYRVVAGGLGFENVRFSAAIGGGRLLGFVVVNWVLLVLTAGLAYPWVQVRIMRLIADVLEIHGQPDFEQIAQRTDDMPKFGEGLAEAFDIGGI